ncbi:cell number regulator 8-like [Juglans regia]|uniref:Cell number regulator 8-like n=1 Tax=Juglans regia TaxID=51240 RepID=A0A6P9EBD7_JUGRE|nr:cell number regulator 8-like [Juglans regia]
MADNNNNNVNYEESSPLLSKQVVEGVEDDAKKASKPIDAKDEKVTVSPAAKAPAPVPGNFGGHGWTANGLPLGHGSVVGEPMGRTQWNSSIFACLGRNDEFCSSDLEVCLLGSVAPCVLYGGNVERLGSSPGTFGNHCLSYSGLYLIGNSIFGGNFLAPWFSYTSRTAIRRMFNLEASFMYCSDMIHVDWSRSWLKWTPYHWRPPVLAVLFLIIGDEKFWRAMKACYGAHLRDDDYYVFYFNSKPGNHGAFCLQEFPLTAIHYLLGKL